MATAGETYDVVIVDPPAFAKSRKDIPTAVKGYRKLVRQAAARLGIPFGTVKSRTHYALHALRLALDEMGGVG